MSPNARTNDEPEEWFLGGMHGEAYVATPEAFFRHLSDSPYHFLLFGQISQTPVPFHQFINGQPLYSPLRYPRALFIHL